MSHYFPDKEALLRAVIAYRADHMRGRISDSPRGPLDSIEALERWAEGRITNEVVVENGCSFGSLSSEILKSEPELHDAIAEGFALWTDDFRTGLEAMRERGDLRVDADLDYLAHVLATAFQGGVLLAQAQRDAAPMHDALEGAIDAVRASAPGN